MVKGKHVLKHNRARARRESSGRKPLPTGFQLLPAIDLLGGMVVRLAEGKFDSQTVYADDPTEFARSFAAAGTRWIHIVDLDGARDGGRRQTAAGARGVEGAGESVACE